MNILLMTDDLQLVQSIRRQLWRSDYDVDVISARDHHFKCDLDRRYSLIILDERLSGEGGKQVIERMRSHGVKSPVLMLTMLRQCVSSIVSVADAYLTRMFQRNDLVSNIQALIHSKEKAHVHEDKV